MKAVVGISTLAGTVYIQFPGVYSFLSILCLRNLISKVSDLALKLSDLALKLITEISGSRFLRNLRILEHILQ